jgi:hypothetical protein
MDSIANPTPPLQTIIPAYAYQQYADDINVVAFFNAYNQIAQSYLSWFNQTPLAVYTSPQVTGQLLDWIGNGIYGIPRPVFSTLSTIASFADINDFAINTLALNSSSFSETGTAIVANDDFYKRTITWFTYAGDGHLFSAMVLRKRIARFLYGVNGTDITLTQAQNVSLVVHTSPVKYTITIPSAANPASSYFQEAFNAATLPLPFNIVATVSIV